MEREQRIGSSGQEAQGFEKTLKFLQRAIAEKAHLKKPPHGNISEDVWVRQKNIVGVYFGSPATGKEIGKIYGGVTRQAIKQSKDSGMRNLWKNCSSETQAEFPFQELILGKPLSQRLRERMSLALGEKRIQLIGDLNAGKSIQQIKEQRVLSTQQIANYRYRLKKRNIEVPYVITPHSKIQELENRLRNAETNEEKQEFLNQVLRKFYGGHVKGENPLLMSIKKVAMEGGFYYNPRDTRLFVEVLKAAGFPLGQIKERTVPKGSKTRPTYSFILSKDKERAKEIFIADPNLQRFRRL